MSRILVFLALIGMVAFAMISQEQTIIYLVGDSTCADKSPDAFPEMGWGTPFTTFFDSSVRIENHAKNGRSTKSFMEEGRWEAVLKALKAGDYVFIQFGHNDEVPSKAGRYTTPEQFQENLRKYVADSRAQRAHPVLLTPVTRRSFDSTGVLQDTHAEYAGLVREVAAAEKVPLIDMTRKSMELVSTWGEEKSVLLFHHLEPGEHPNYPGGKTDNTHFNELGARKMAQLVLQGILELDLGLEQFIVKKK